MAEEERLRFEVGGKKYHLLTQDGRLYFEDVFDDESTSCIYEIVFDGKYVKAKGYDGLVRPVEPELCQLFDVPKDRWIDFYLETIKTHPHYEGFIDAMKEMFGIAEEDRLEKENRDLQHFITRGGFIKDRNGKWCKEGDIICLGCDIDDVDDKNEWERWWLKFSKDDNAFRMVAIRDGFSSSADSPDFELIEPCEPDICKDFEEME